MNQLITVTLAPLTEGYLGCWDRGWGGGGEGGGGMVRGGGG